MDVGGDDIVGLLRVLGTPFASSQRGSETCFSRALYRFALANKVALSYLSKCGGGVAVKLYAYHRSRLEVLMGVLCRVCRVLGEGGFDYVVFKTLRPFEEDVADIDVLYLSRGVDGYRGLVAALRGAGLRVMEEGFYCVTFMDPGYRFVAEVMVDVYREVSVGPLVYLDKRLLVDRVTSRVYRGCRVRVLDPVGELLVTVAHSVIKEREVKLLDYLTALHLLHAMGGRGLGEYVGLARESGLVYASRLFLSIVARLHGLAHGFVPGRLVELLDMLGGAVDVGEVVRGVPPYKVGWKAIARVAGEKLRDPVFRSSLIWGSRWFLSRRSWARLARVVF